MTAAGPVYHLALRELHAAAGARFKVVNSWSVPGDYGDWLAEHAALRSGVSVFDRSTRSRILVTGTDALDVLSATFAGHVDELEEGRAMRTVRLGASGEIRDLVLIARTGGIAYLVSGEPGQRFETLRAIEHHHEEDYEARIDDRTESTCMVAVAGPAAAEFVREHLADALPARLQLLHCVAFELHGFRALATRTGDTGEDGFELMIAPAVAQHIIETLTTAGATLVGFDAQEAARVEACIPAFHPDLETGLSPAEADLDALLDVPGGRERSMLTAVMLEGESVVAAGTELRSNGERVGEVRSAVWSPALSSVVALAVIEARLVAPGRTLDASGRRATIVGKPFYRRRT